MPLDHTPLNIVVFRVSFLKSVIINGPLSYLPPVVPRWGAPRAVARAGAPARPSGSGRCTFDQTEMAGRTYFSRNWIIDTSLWKLTIFQFTFLPLDSLTN